MKDLRKQREARGRKRIASIGDYARCPECNRVARLVWISEDGRSAGIRCPGRHRQMGRGSSQLGSRARPHGKTEKNMVFLIEIEPQPQGRKGDA